MAGSANHALTAADRAHTSSVIALTAPGAPILIRFWIVGVQIDIILEINILYLVDPARHARHRTRQVARLEGKYWLSNSSLPSW